MNGLPLKPGRVSAQSSVIPAFAKDRNQLRRMVEKDSAEEIEPRRIPVPVATKAVAVEPSVPEVTVFMDGEFDNAAALVPPQNPARHVDGPYHTGPQKKPRGPNGSPLMFGQPGQPRSLPGQTQPLPGQQELLHRYYGPQYGPPAGQGGASLRQNQPHQQPQHELIQQELPPKHQGPLPVQQGPTSGQLGMHYPAPANKPLSAGTKSGKVDGNVHGYPGAFGQPRATVSPHQYSAAYTPYSHQQPFYQPARYQNLANLSSETPYRMVASAPYFYPQQQYPIDPYWQFVFRPPTPAAQVNSRPPQKPQSILRNPLHRTAENHTDTFAHSSGSTDSGLQAYDSFSPPHSPPQRTSASVQPSPNMNVDIYQLYMEQKAEIEKLRKEIEGLRTEKEKQDERTRCTDCHRQCFCETMTPVDSNPPSRCNVAVNTTRNWQAAMDNTADSSKHSEGSAVQNQSSNSRIQAQKCKDNQPMITPVRKDNARHSQEMSPVAKSNGFNSPHQDHSFSQVLADGADVRLESSDVQPGSRERSCAPFVKVQSSCPMVKADTCNGPQSSDNQPMKSTLSKDCDGHLERMEQRPVGKDSSVPVVSHSPIHGGRCGAEFETSAEQMGNFCSQDVISSSPMKCLNADQGKNTWLAGAMLKPDEEGVVCGQTEPFGNAEDGRPGRIVERWLDDQCDYRHDYHHDNEYLMNGQTLMSMLSTYSVDQSGLDQTYLPRIEYVARVPTSRCTSELTIAADALAMKYLSDDALLRLQSSGSRRNDTAALHDTSEISMWNGHSNQMSFASREYLQKHGLLPAKAKSPSGKLRGHESSGTFEISTDDESEGTKNGVNVAVFFQKFPNALSSSRNSSQQSDAACIGSGNSAPGGQNGVFYGSRPQSNVLDRTLDLVGEVERDGSNKQNGYLDYDRRNKDRIDRPAIPSAAVPGVDLILDFNMNNFPKLL